MHNNIPNTCKYTGCPAESSKKMIPQILHYSKFVKTNKIELKQHHVAMEAKHLYTEKIMY